MAGSTIYVTHFDVGDMGEIYTIRLFRIDEPGNFFVIGDIFCHERFFFRRLSKGGFGIIVAFGATFQFWDAGKCAVIAKCMTKQALLSLCFSLYAIHFFRVEMKGVIKINWLGVFGIKHRWKDDPSQDRSSDEA